MQPCNRFRLKKAPFREVWGLRTLPATEVRVELSVEENERCEYEAICSCRQRSFSILGESGRGNYAQISLKCRPGQWASTRAAYGREARTTTRVIW